MNSKNEDLQYSTDVSTEKLNKISSTDILTGLPHRQSFIAVLDQLSDGGIDHCALLLVDLDDMHLINSAFGYAAGDNLLQVVANHLSTCISDGDVLARVGDDEFGIILHDISSDYAVAMSIANAVGKKINENINRFDSIKDKDYQGSVSVGAVMFVNSKTDDLLRNAGMALRKAKKDGKNKTCFFQEEMRSAIVKKASLVSDVRKALLNEQFSVVYQAQVDNVGRIIGAETLVRWRHPTRGIINPAEFLYSAEQSGLILPLGKFVLETACAQITEWTRTPERSHLSVSVNVSVLQVQQEKFVDEVINVLKQCGADPKKLVLEVTPDLFASNVENTVIKMKHLREVGVRFAIDDFGTGSAAFSHIRHLPLDQLKMDIALLPNLTDNGADASIANLVIELGKQFNIDVIAESVETTEQREFLENKGCLIYQGYFHGKPLPIAEFNKQIATSEDL
jgi:diguanylate cyclase (GGDEF)-like protein